MFQHRFTKESIMEKEQTINRVFGGLQPDVEDVIFVGEQQNFLHQYSRYAPSLQPLKLFPKINRFVNPNVLFFFFILGVPRFSDLSSRRDRDSPQLRLAKDKIRAIIKVLTLKLSNKQ